VASTRTAIPLEARARAAVVLEQVGAVALLGPWRSDPDVAQVRWSSGGRASALRSGLERLAGDLARSGEPAVGLAVVSVAQAFVLARLDEETGSGA